MRQHTIFFFLFSSKQNAMWMAVRCFKYRNELFYFSWTISAIYPFESGIFWIAVDISLEHVHLCVQRRALVLNKIHMTTILLITLGFPRFQFNSNCAFNFSLLIFKHRFLALKDYFLITTETPAVKRRSSSQGLARQRICPILYFRSHCGFAIFVTI